MTMLDVIGIDHIYVTVSDLARSEVFYDTALCHVLGFKKNIFVLNGDRHVQYYNRHFGYVIRPSHGAQPYDAYVPGLHHFCFRVDSVADVHEAADRLRAGGIEASAAVNHPEYAPDYWATFLADPDGIRLEITNYRQERRARHDRWPNVE
jgi:glyoxylase I family protein